MNFVNLIHNKFVKLGIATIVIVAISSINPLNITYDENNLEINIDEKYDMEGKNFSLLLNNEEVLSTRSNLISNFKKIDSEKPNIPQDIEHFYKSDGINIKWSKVEDNGTDNDYRVIIKNDKGLTIKSSNKVSINYNSGIEDYTVYINNKVVWQGGELETFIKNEEFKLGINKIVVRASDNAKNYSETEYEILYEEIKIRNNNNVISIDNTNKEKYLYNLKVDESDSNYEFTDKIDMTSVFKDSKAPNKPSITTDINNTTAKVTFKTEEVGTKYKYQVFGTSVKKYNEVFSEVKEVEIKSDIKGYFYHIGEETEYSVTDKNTFIEDTEVNISQLDYKTYYVHAIAVDSNNNKSEQTTYSFKIERPVINTPNIDTKPNINDYFTSGNNNSNSGNSNNNQSSGSQNNSGITNNDVKMNLILSMVKSYGEINYSQYNTHINAVYSYMPTSILNVIKSYNVRIGYVSTNLRQFLINNEGYDPGIEIRGIYIPNGRKVYVSTTATVRSSVHEISHAFDRANASGLRSQQSDFYNLYIEEGKAMFGADSYYISDEKEYFAEAFTKYLMDVQTLKAKAPKTYAYFKSVL